MDKHQSQSLIDHELLTAPTSDGSLKRVAAFGWYAGGELCGYVCPIGQLISSRGGRRIVVHDRFGASAARHSNTAAGKWDQGTLR